MADLSVTFAGIPSPNPFWLASAPPSNTGEQVARAFDHGWGGAVWKTLCHEDDEVVNVSSRLAAIRGRSGRTFGINNLELISDRPLTDNLAEIARLKTHYPDKPIIASVMTGERRQWESLIRQCEEAGADGFELNFGCPHGMCERGMGSAVGQDTNAIETITGWAKRATEKPVLVKLTPNITDIREPGRAAVRAGADGLALINTISSLMGVDLDRFVPYPVVGTRSSHGGYAGPAVKPIALQMVAALARDRQITIPISGIGGITNWRDCAEFMLLGATTVQVCTGVMLAGFRIVRDMQDGLGDWMDEKGFTSCADYVGKAVPNFVDWGDLDLSYRVVARIDHETCIGCQLCYPACRDGGHQAIRIPETQHAVRSVRLHGVAHRRPEVDAEHCVGCNLCSLVCPVPGCITMEVVEPLRSTAVRDLPNQTSA
ncbi:MAG: NAD-dependent dihydropyrimidine dehydrogenase subunit PreA [Candidatus Eisenbacteria bacterium]|nr:NAD-dependent dihydropyrimidine dehydrogenase subunit PreA [Candidatus Eisenbacteria bacterium]